MMTESLQIEHHDGHSEGRSRSAYRHGLRSGKLPFKGGSAIERYSNEYRRALENELISAGREIGVAEATTIAAATAWYIHAQKARKWLTTHHDELTHDQRLNFSREEARALGEAARLVKSLGVEREKSTEGAWGAVYNQPVATAEAPAHVSQDTPKGHLGEGDSDDSGTQTVPQTTPEDVVNGKTDRC